jgi:osmotically-inducible protein OsmY
MADRWTEERNEREWRDREPRAGRYGRSSDNGGQEYGGADEQDDRSFEPRSDYGREGRQGGGQVFGERESGADYTGPRYGAGGYSGYTAGGYDDRTGGGQRSYGDRNYTTRSYGRGAGGRFYGDDGRQDIYREQQYGPGSSGGSSSGGSSYGSGRDDSQRAYQRAYGGERDYRGSDRDQQREEGDRGFWARASDRVASWFSEDDNEDRARDRDKQRNAGHRGRGPQGYKRSDDRISEEVHERLTDDPWVDATNITIMVSSGEVTLSGTVPEREAKHRAERIVENLSGVDHVQNNLRVQRANPLTEPGRGFGDSAAAAQMSSGDTSASTNPTGATTSTTGDGKSTLGRTN